jgi:hypothetical protein
MLLNVAAQRRCPDLAHPSGWQASSDLPMVGNVGGVFRALADPTRRAILDELTDWTLRAVLVGMLGESDR